jgi:3-oxocholest-4-en-26-oate---CoA ligase
MLSFHLADLIESVVDVHPDRVALIADPVTLTYRELDERANRTAHALQARGVGPGDHVGIYAVNRAEWLESMLACMKLRAIPINVNYRYVEAELRYLIDNADLVAMVVERRYLQTLSNVLPDVQPLRGVLILEDGTPAAESPEVPGGISYEDALSGVSAERDFGERSNDDLYVLYTGGTTGMPKGVLWRQEDFYFAAIARPGPDGALPATPQDVARNVSPNAIVFTCLAPLMHGAAQLSCIICFTMGGTMALWTGRRFDPDGVWSMISTSGANSVMVVGDGMGRPLVEALEESPGKWDLSSLFVVSSSGAVLTEETRGRFQTALPNIMVMEAYGASELGHNGQEVGDGRRRVFKLNDDTKVLDENLDPVPPGSDLTGMIGRSGHIPLGYHKDPEKTARTFLHDRNGVRWVVPGDHAQVLEDGSVLLLGRGSAVVNTGGEKVYPEEVENAIVSHPDVVEAVVTGAPDPRFGERVVALVVASPGVQIDPTDVIAHARKSVAGYKVPKEVHVVDEIRRTPAGKSDVKWAKDTAASLSASS